MYARLSQRHAITGKVIKELTHKICESMAKYGLLLFFLGLDWAQFLTLSLSSQRRQSRLESRAHGDTSHEIHHVSTQRAVRMTVELTVTAEHA
jgi:hypothetical protein